MIKHKYRFKTEQEFIREFGENWENRIGWNNMGDMDYLLGEIFPYIYIGIKSYELNDRYWCISKEMLIKNKIINYNPLKLIFN